MSSSAKRKITQNDLRILMADKRRKLDYNRKIESPLAKYLPDGTIMCVICNTVIKAESLWSIHINSKQHSDSIDRKKFQSIGKGSLFNTRESALNKQPPTSSEPKKVKGILKNKTVPNNSVSLVPVTLNECDNKLKTDDSIEVCHMDVDESEVNFTKASTLPEGFFDDPVLDAKARNVEYKDPQEEEWEKFQKEIKEETSLSTVLVEEDQEEASTDRRIEEIDEQIQNWSRILNLEVKKEKVQEAVRNNMNNDKNDNDDSSYGTDEEVEEFFNWRSKS